MKFKTIAVVGAIACLWQPAFATTYTQDTVLSHFTNGISNYATFSNFSAGDTGSPFTPTSAELATNGYRVYDGGSLVGLPTSNNWILATFASGVSAIRVFANIDHLGAAYDGYQYSIQGSNNLTSWAPLFDALTVNGAGEPFTLGTFTGTAPTTVNNVVNGPNGVGYEADFTFGTSYKYYAFGASTVAFQQGNSDQELSAVAAAPIPEPETYALMLAGLGAIGFIGRRRRKSAPL
ncbi:MAG: PEP-CTERM sorting domain-containing protein [Pseudomonadota bacterium]|nr:PEP-CTERM sorting domain-containing protein [Pseudomonadota bacterium]